MENRGSRIEEMQKALEQKRQTTEDEFRQVMELVRRFSPQPGKVRRPEPPIWECPTAPSLDYRQKER